MMETNNMIDKNILFYDGTCGFCDRVIQLSNKWIRDEEIYFTPLQGTTAENFKEKYAEFPNTIDAIVYHEAGKIYTGAKAFYQLSRHYKRPYKFFNWFRLLPEFLSDFGYNIVAKNRYKLFGRVESCEIPDVKFRKRMLP